MPTVLLIAFTSILVSCIIIIVRLDAPTKTKTKHDSKVSNFKKQHSPDSNKTVVTKHQEQHPCPTIENDKIIKDLKAQIQQLQESMVEQEKTRNKQIGKDLESLKRSMRQEFNSTVQDLLQTERATTEHTTQFMIGQVKTDF